MSLFIGIDTVEVFHQFTKDTSGNTSNVNKYGVWLQSTIQGLSHSSIQALKFYKALLINQLSSSTLL